MRKARVALARHLAIIMKAMLARPDGVRIGLSLSQARNARLALSLVDRLAASEAAGIRNVRLTSILLKNSEIEGRRKSRIRAHSVVYASRCYSKTCERGARSKADRSAGPLRKFPLRPPAVF
jgi:hypothetical protein